MNPTDFETLMRRGERYHPLRVEDGTFTVIRVDGRGFSELTRQRGFEKPFDARFHASMLITTRALMAELHGAYGYTQSDEISVLLPKDTTLFGRDVEKLVSLAASSASVAFSLETGIPALFDARLWVSANPSEVGDYFSWRMSDSGRNSLQGLAYWSLRRLGLDGRAATERLNGLNAQGLHTLLRELGLDWAALPAWQRRGAGCWDQGTEKTGYNPREGREVTVTRRTLKTDLDLPTGDAYRQFIARFTADPESADR